MYRRASSHHNFKRTSTPSAQQQAKELFRMSPTNGTNGSSPMSSLSCESDDMTNDGITLEEGVINLSQKIQSLQDQVNYLSEGQISNEDRYTRVKQENQNLLTKIHSLEEQLRDIEIQSDERREEEEHRYRDLMARHERERSQESEQYLNRIYSLQQELLEAKEESKNYKSIVERLQNAKTELEELINDKTIEIEALILEITKLRDVVHKREDENNVNSRLIEVLNQELCDMKAPKLVETKKTRTMSSSDDIDMLYNSEIDRQLKELKEENRGLREANEELSALLLNNGLEEGRNLLRQGEVASSLATELGNYNSDQLRVALKEQQEVNVKLRAYIDGILLNIVENYPQLLEVKNK
ncbi:rab11 family-interacting protein 4B-like isoform X2 [Oppia nitens]|uniref:rab11 family-interacting protein 4B-like isoform X2 n=1 Tax=Oppia nitens TaxID=1686743 RepID=UPI0023DB6562|nr:rab11 family-interacting protein 4B-like isoform X2 [Oppia nitens]